VGGDDSAEPAGFFSQHQAADGRPQNPDELIQAQVSFLIGAAPTARITRQKRPAAERASNRVAAQEGRQEKRTSL